VPFQRIGSRLIKGRLVGICAAVVWRTRVVVCRGV
jgi:hypothetical protein